MVHNSVIENDDNVVALDNDNSNTEDYRQHSTTYEDNFLSEVSKITPKRIRKAPERLIETTNFVAEQ